MRFALAVLLLVASPSRAGASAPAATAAPDAHLVRMFQTDVVSIPGGPELALPLCRL